MRRTCNRSSSSPVAVDADDQSIGYIVADLVDGNAHVEQVSVLPHHQTLSGKGKGKVTPATAAGIETQPLVDHPAV